MELVVQEQTHASEHKSSGASRARHTTSTSCPSEAVAAPCSSSSMRPLHMAGSARTTFRCHSNPVVALTLDATFLPQGLGEENSYLQTSKEEAGASPLVAPGTSVHPMELMVSRQPPQTCLLCSFQSGQDQNVSEVLMPVERARFPGSQLPENLVSQPRPRISGQCGRSLDLPLLCESLQYEISQKTGSSPVRSARVAGNLLRPPPAEKPACLDSPSPVGRFVLAKHCWRRARR